MGVRRPCRPYEELRESRSRPGTDGPGLDRTDKKQGNHPDLKVPEEGSTTGEEGKRRTRKATEENGRRPGEPGKQAEPRNRHSRSDGVPE